MELVKWQNGGMPSFSSLLDEFFSKDPFEPVGGRLMATAAPAVNIRETDSNFILEVAAPGFEKKDFTVQVNRNNQLIISSERKTDERETEGRYTRREFSRNAFRRSFTLPETVDSDKISASYENGMLVLTLPKREEAKTQPARVIEIE